MNNINIIEKLTMIDIAIGKKMFKLSKACEVKNPPSPLQFKILGYLIQNKEKNICQKTLETNFNVSKATISGVLLTMEKNGIISRSTSENDAREKNIELTDLSIKRFKEMREINDMINEKILNNIEEDDLNTFLTVLYNMKKNLDKIEDGEEKNDQVI